MYIVVGAITAPLLSEDVDQIRLVVAMPPQRNILGNVSCCLDSSCEMPYAERIEFALIVLSWQYGFAKEV